MADNNFLINATTVLGGLWTRWVKKGTLDNSPSTPVSLIDVGGSGDEKLLGDYPMPVSIGNQLSGYALDTSLQAILTKLNSSIAVTGSFYQATQPVSIASMPTTPVTGTFWQAIQPISASSLPLPTGAATSANQPALNVDGGALSHVTNFPSFTFTGTDLNVKFSNTSITTVQSGVWNIGSITTLPAVSIASGQSVTVNTIAGFALESGNLATIATNSNKFNFTSNNLNVTFSNTSINVGTVTTLPNVTLNNQTNGYAQESGGNLAAIATATGTQADASTVNSQIGLLKKIAGLFSFSSTNLNVNIASKLSTPTLRQNVGSILTSSSSGAIASNAYSTTYLTIDNTTNNALLADFSITPTFGTAPVTGSLQLIAVDWSIAATPVQGAAPSATMLGRVVGTFSPQATTSNTATSWVCRLNGASLTGKTDFYVFNNATGQSINSGLVISAQCWTPGN